MIYIDGNDSDKMNFKVTKIEANDSIIPKKIRVAAYARVSTNSEEQLSSLETQKEHYESVFLNDECYEFVGIYYDEGISGTKIDKRDGLLSLLKDCDAGKIDRVVTKSISRFSRNITDCLKMVRHLSKLNISILFEKENIDSAHMSSELMLSILSSIAESESKSISQNEKWAIKHRFEEGNYKISTPPYGYKNVDDKMVIVQDEAKLVKRIFDEALSGYGSKLIAKNLNDEKIPSRRGKKWNASVILGILKNRAYTGDVIFQKSYTSEDFKRHINRGEENQYLYLNHHEAIVTHEIFDEVNKEIQRRRRIHGIDDTERYRNRYCFSKRIICGECGSSLKRVIRQTANGSYVGWTCTTHINKKDSCSLKTIKESTLKFAFVRMMNKLQVTRIQILKPFVTALKFVDNKDRLHQIDELEERINKNKEQQQALSKLVNSGYLEADTYTKELNVLLKEAGELAIEKHNLKKNINYDLSHLHEAEKLLKYLNQDIEIKEFDDEVFLDFVETITVKNRNTFVFNMKCGLHFREVIHL